MYSPLGVVYGFRRSSTARSWPLFGRALLRAPGGAEGRGTTGHRATGPSPRSFSNHSGVVFSASATLTIV